MPAELSTRQIAEAGRLLVQYRLYLEGVESERNLAGVRPHLVTADGQTISVYSNRAPKPAGGKGRPALAWMLDGNVDADLVAVADLSTDRVWLFGSQEAFQLAQQHPPSGGHHLVMVTDPELMHSKHDRILDSDFDDFLLQRRALALLACSSG